MALTLKEAQDRAAARKEQGKEIAKEQYAINKAKADEANRIALLNTPPQVIAKLPKATAEKITKIQKDASNAERLAALKAQNATIGPANPNAKPLLPTFGEKVTRFVSGTSGMDDVTRAKIKYADKQVQKETQEKVQKKIAESPDAYKPSRVGAVLTNVLSSVTPSGGEQTPYRIALEAKKQQYAVTNPKASGVGALLGGAVPLAGGLAQGSKYIERAGIEEDPYKLGAGIVFTALGLSDIVGLNPLGFIGKQGVKTLEKGAVKFTPQVVKNLQTKGVEQITKALPNISKSEATKIIADTIVTVSKQAAEGSMTGAAMGGTIGAAQYAGEEGKQGTLKGALQAGLEGAKTGAVVGGAIGGAVSTPGAISKSFADRAKALEEAKTRIAPEAPQTAVEAPIAPVKATTPSVSKSFAERQASIEQRAVEAPTIKPEVTETVAPITKVKAIPTEIKPVTGKVPTIEEVKPVAQPKAEKLEPTTVKRLNAVRDAMGRENPEIKAAIDSGEFGKLDMLYKRYNIEEGARIADDYAALANKTQIRDIMRGTAVEPKGTTRTAIMHAAYQKAIQEKDYKFATEVGSKMAMRNVRLGQEIVANRGAIDIDSPLFFANQVIDARMRNAGKKLAITTESVKKGVKENVIRQVEETTERAKRVLTKEVAEKLGSAQKLIDELTCKI